MQTVYESVDGFSEGNEGACGDFITNDQPILNRAVINDITVYVVDSRGIPANFSNFAL
jgi:hypothetical protein